ncbi:MAG: rod shape-determining protein MreD [Deltaproteobacteria bacterium]
MRRLIPFAVLIALAGLAQVTLLSDVRVFGAGPDLFLALCVIAAVSLDPRRALLTGLFGGVLKDLFDPGPFAVNCIVFPLMTLLISRLNRTLPLESRLSCSIVTAISVLAVNITAWIMLAFAQVTLAQGALLRIMFLESLLTALASAALFTFVKPADYSRP